MPMIKNISSKWKKTKALLMDSRMRRFVPNTKLLSPKTLKTMLTQYGMVYVRLSTTFGKSKTEFYDIRLLVP